MNLRRIFRRTRPTPAPATSVHDIRVIAAWGLDEEEWASLTTLERAQCRATYTKAPRYRA